MKIRIHISQGKGDAKDGYEFEVTLPDAYYLEAREVLDPAATLLMDLFRESRHKPRPDRLKHEVRA